MNKTILIALLILTIPLFGFRTVYPDVGPTEINPGTIYIDTNVQFSIENIESVVRLGAEIALVKSIYVLKFQTEQDTSNFDIFFPITNTDEDGFLFKQKNSNVSLSINGDLKIPELCQIDINETNLLMHNNRYSGNYYHYKILENKSLIELEINYRTEILRKSGNLYCNFIFSPIPENYENTVSSLSIEVSFLDIDITSITNLTPNGLIKTNQEILWIQKNINRKDAEILINFEKKSGLSNYLSQNVEYLEKAFYYFDKEDITIEELSAEIEYICKQDSVKIASLKDLLPTIFEIADSKDPKDAIEFYLWIRLNFGDVLNISGKFSYLNFKIAETYFVLCEFNKAADYYMLLIENAKLTDTNIRNRAESLFYKRSKRYSKDDLYRWSNYFEAKGLIEYCNLKINAIKNIQRTND